ncbi:MAG TPA: nuclear transport factor 2 family protein [Candidatus Binataceae bacterium]|nr:nuclear transport factor 2 family protein [Candidatus Binataceae bacterium]
MTEAAVAEFVTRFAAAWAARDGDLFLALWHADGLLHTPLVGSPITGSELPRLNEVQKHVAPDLVWQLLDWSWRPTPDGAIVMIEWQTTRIVEGKRFDWRGVDKFTLREGKIAEERVYQDTAPLRARRSGEKLEPLIRI